LTKHEACPIKNWKFSEIILFFIIMEEKNDDLEKMDPEQERRREIDLNTLFPERSYDLNRLFPDDGTKKLLYELRRNKRDIERFIKSLQVEEE